MVNERKHLIETWGKVLLTSGYTDMQIMVKISEHLVQKGCQNYWRTTCRRLWGPLKGRHNKNKAKHDLFSVVYKSGSIILMFSILSEGPGGFRKLWKAC